MTISYTFEFERGSKIFYPGEKILGKVSLISSKVRQLKDISLKFESETIVQWYERDRTAINNIQHNDSSNNDVSNKVLYENNDKHVYQHLRLDTNKIMLSHIEYTYKFQIDIPDYEEQQQQHKHLTATCLTKYGRTEYKLIIMLQQQNKNIAKEYAVTVFMRNKLDLLKEVKLKEPFWEYAENSSEQLSIQLPCTGYCPGQSIPYSVKFHSAQAACKTIVQLNCYTEYYSSMPEEKVKCVKQLINHRKHLMCRATVNGEDADISYLRVPLGCHLTSDSTNKPALISFNYKLDIFLVNSQKKILLNICVPLKIGSESLLNSEHLNFPDNHYLCYDNLGSPFTQTSSDCGRATVTAFSFTPTDLNFGQGLTSLAVAQQIYESLLLLPLKKQSHLRRSLKYCYKKLIKLI